MEVNGFKTDMLMIDLQHPENELDVFSYYNSKLNNSGIKLIYTKYYSIRNVVINREFF